jgi:hypothetical protein
LPDNLKLMERLLDLKEYMKNIAGWRKIEIKYKITKNRLWESY